jgi:hypothetical protein
MRIASVPRATHNALAEISAQESDLPELRQYC